MGVLGDILPGVLEPLLNTIFESLGNSITGIIEKVSDSIGDLVDDVLDELIPEQDENSEEINFNVAQIATTIGDRLLTFFQEDLLEAIDLKTVFSDLGGAIVNATKDAL